MIDIPVSEWESGSSYDPDSGIPYENPDGSGTAIRIPPHSPTYPDWCGSKYIITGSII